MNGILVPVKTLTDAKGRLAERLSQDDRHRLGIAMLSDVLMATVTWRCWVVTSDEEAAKLAIELGCDVIDDAGNGLNDAIRSGTKVALEAGASGLLVIPADVPLAEADDVTRAFAVEAAVGVAPSADGGTNALLRRPPDAIDPHFGAESARVHAEAASAAGAGMEFLDLPSLVVDVDRFEDLKAVAASQSMRESVLLAREFLSRA